MSERIAAPEDIVTQVMWRGVRARICARRGDAEEGEALAREAVRLAEPTDLLVLRADALLDLAEVVDREGSPRRPKLPLRRRSSCTSARATWSRPRALGPTRRYKDPPSDSLILRRLAGRERP